MQAVILVCLVAIALGFAALAVRSSHYPNGKETYCQKDNANQENCAAYDATAVLLWKVGKAIENHNGAINAMSGVAVAGFTGTLWWVTRNMVNIANKQRSDTMRSIEAAEASARAAERSAIAAIGVELPKLLLCEIDFADMGAAGFRARLQYPKVEVAVRNYGRTPAFISERTVEIECFGVSWPPVEYYQPYNTPPGTVVEGREIFRLGPARPRRLFTEAEIEGFFSLTNRMAVYGYIIYSDFLGAKHIARFYRELFVREDGYSWTEGNPPEEYTKSF